MPKNKAFTATKLLLSELTNEEAKNRLETKFLEYRVERQLSVELQRKALVAQLEAKNQEGKAQISLTKLLLEAGEHFDPIQTEPIWFAYRANDEIVFESPFTERDMRNGIRLQRKQMEQAAQNLDESGHDDLYESGSED